MGYVPMDFPHGKILQASPSAELHQRQKPPPPLRRTSGRPAVVDRWNVGFQVMISGWRVASPAQNY